MGLCVFGWLRHETCVSQGAKILQPSDSVHLRAPAPCDEWREDMGCNEGGDGGGVWGEMEFKTYGGTIKEKHTQSIY